MILHGGCNSGCSIRNAIGLDLDTTEIKNPVNVNRVNGHVATMQICEGGQRNLKAFSNKLIACPPNNERADYYE